MFGQDTIEKTDALLRSLDTKTLLNAAYSLTHRIHAATAGERQMRQQGQLTLAVELANELVDLREQRDLIDAEIERRCA